jgi:hypothetical protein
MPTSLRHDTPSIDLEEINSHWPPIADFSNETPSQRDQRLQHEREAKRINDEIDAQLEIEKSERRKRRPDIRIILLGAFLFCLVHLPPSSSFFYQNFTSSSLSPSISSFSRDVSPIQARPSQVNQRSCATFNSNLHRPLSTQRQKHGEPSSTSTSYVPSHSYSTSSRKVAPPAPAPARPPMPPVAVPTRT